MTLTQPIVIASQGKHDDGRGVMAVALAALMLLAAMAVLVLVGLRPAPAEASAHTAPTATTSPIAKAHEPACAAALSRARDTRGLSAQDAIAASTAMLRACDIH